MNLSVRRAVLRDAETIVAYNAAMAKETENLELDRERLALGVRAVLDDAAKGFYVVAEKDGLLVGQMLITFEWSDWRNGVFWWIQSVYVHPEHRRLGVYKSLHSFVTREARCLGGVCGLRLYVEKENRVARRVYERLGLAKSSYAMYEADFVIAR